MRAKLVLTPNERAIFTERAATEGTHSTLACPPGSALLGWAAAHGPYAKFADSFAIFHSGKVRFSNALPLLEDGTPAYPIPRILLQPKHSRGGIGHSRLIPDKWLVRDKLRVWHPARKDKTDPQDDRPSEDEGIQYDALDNKGKVFVAADGRVVESRFGDRLRTATRGGRAAEGQLFGYRHLEPGNSFAASIEADDGSIKPEDWERLLAAFRGRTLFLGRGAGAYYGGAYDCVVIDDAGDELWPSASVAADATFVRVWALSDLALVDTRGAACFAPSAAMLGLAAGGSLNSRESPIATRRYSPWNAHLDRRDVERQVIAAGSVLTFDCPQRPGAGAIPGAVGLWREAGLGRIWVAPPILQVPAGERPQLPQFSEIHPAPEGAVTGAPAPDNPLVHWTLAAKAASATRESAEQNAAREKQGQQAR